MGNLQRRWIRQGRVSKQSSFLGTNMNTIVTIGNVIWRATCQVNISNEKEKAALCWAARKQAGDPIMDSAKIPWGSLRSDAPLTTNPEGPKTWQVQLAPLCELRRSHHGYNKRHKDTLRASKKFVISGVLDSWSSSTKRASNRVDRGEKPEPKAGLQETCESNAIKRVSDEDYPVIML